MQELSESERTTVDRFNAAHYPAEVAEAALVETVARAIFGFLPAISYNLRMALARDAAAAAIAAYRSAQDGGAEEAVRRVEPITSQRAWDRAKSASLQATLTAKAGERPDAAYVSDDGVHFGDYR